MQHSALLPYLGWVGLTMKYISTFNYLTIAAAIILIVLSDIQTTWYCDKNLILGHIRATMFGGVNVA